MIVGAWAVMAHGWPRSSGDVDFVVQLPFAERKPVVDLLTRLGHKAIEERKDEWGQRVVVQIADNLELEVFFTPPRPPYDEEYARRVIIDVESESVPFLSAEDLVVRKLVNTRLRRGIDFDDVVGILVTQRGKLDLARIRTKAGFYRVEATLDRAIEAADTEARK